MRHEETDMPLLPGERVDETGFGALKLIQKPEEFCYGVDAVLLADFGAKYARPSVRCGSWHGHGDRSADSFP